MKISYMLLPLLLLALVFSCRSVQNKAQVQNQDQPVYSGLVIGKKVFPGTMSEYTVYSLLGADGSSVLLFNLSNVSAGFEDYSGREVRVVGSPGSGTIGWKRTRTNGILVREIVTDANGQDLPVR
jgi:hypothetical protein